MHRFSEEILSENTEKVEMQTVKEEREKS